MQKYKCSLISLSNPLTLNNKNKISALKTLLKNDFENVLLSDFAFECEKSFRYSEKEKADEFNSFFKDENIKAVFDISGGDLANGMLEFIDYDLIKSNEKMLFGYSDLTCILNAVYAMTGVKTYLYQIKNVLNDRSMKRYESLINFINSQNNNICKLNYNFIQGSFMQGTAVGGNIRCFSKLIGTKYMPCCKDKIVFLESFSGGLEKIYSLVFHLKQSGAFDRCNGVLLGTFTEIEKNDSKDELFSMVKNILPDIPIAYTDEIGHAENSKCLVIGENYLLK